MRLGMGWIALRCNDWVDELGYILLYTRYPCSLRLYLFAGGVCMGWDGIGCNLGYDVRLEGWEGVIFKASSMLNIWNLSLYMLWC